MKGIIIIIIINDDLETREQIRKLIKTIMENKAVGDRTR